MSGIYDSKMNSVAQLDVEKLAALVSLYVFNIGFPASPFDVRYISGCSIIKILVC